MKKLVSIILCLILSISMSTLLTGCLGTIFDGEYREVELSEIETLMPEITKANKTFKIDYDAGVRLYLSADMTSGDTRQTENVTIRSIKTDNAFKAEGSFTMRNIISSTSETQVVRGDFYSTKTISYISLVQEEETVKIAYLEGIIDSFKETFEPMMEYVEIDYYIEESKNTPEAKWYIDDASENIKIKLDYNDSDGARAKIIWIYNAEYKLSAFEVVLSQTYKTGSAKITFSFEPWSGTITPPTDLDSYIFIKS